MYGAEAFKGLYHLLLAIDGIAQARTAISLTEKRGALRMAIAFPDIEEPFISEITATDLDKYDAHTLVSRLANSVERYRGQSPRR